MPKANILTLQYEISDAKQFEQEALWMNGLLLLSLVLFSTKLLSLWALALTLSVALTRWMICVHELFHIVGAEEVNPWVRRILIPFTLINIGYKEYRLTHMGHHKYNASEEDPEAYHIRGSHLKTFVNAIFYPELSTKNYLSKNGWQSVDLHDMSLRMVIFIGLLILFKVKFLVFWLVLRLIYAVNTWTFFHCLHVKNKKYGVYPVSLPDWIKRLYAMAYGNHSLQATINHDVHHAWPRVAYWNLAKLRHELN